MRGQIPRSTAISWARTVIQVLRAEYPASMHHESQGPDDTDCTPHKLHPAFHGSYDWHSAVHMLCSGVHLLGHPLGRELFEELADLIGERLTPENIAVEVEYLRTHPLFERPYGWAWAVQLGRVCRQSHLTVTDEWAAALKPLQDHLEEAIAGWLDTQDFPIRHGVHDNSALALFLMHESVSPALQNRIAAKAREWYGQDRDYPYAWELGGNDFVSNGLAQAVLMQEVMEKDEFKAWFAEFLPDPEAALDFYTQAPAVSVPTDGKLAHLYGLALTRAWMLRTLSCHLPGNQRAQTISMVRPAREHLEGDNFAATHWLITYALLAVRADTLIP